jgi:hypothetical protein
MKKTDLYLKPGTYIKSSTTSGEVQGISLENFVVSVLNNPTCCPKPPGSPDGMLMTALPLNLTLQTVTDFVGNNSAIQLSTLRLGIRSDSSVTTQTSSVIQATTTNASLVIAPNGTGALVASIPDGTLTGGNARGNNAVDLQMSRITATQVATSSNSGILSGVNNTVNSSSDESVIAGGALNQVTNTRSAVLGGFSNHAAFPYSTVVGGQSNTASAFHSFIGGGQSNNISSGNWSTISGGQSNTASTGTHATVVGGQSNTSSGIASVSGGLLNTASGNYAVALGNTNAVSGRNSVGIGQSNTVNQIESYALGYDNTASSQYGAIVGANNTISGGIRNYAFGFQNTSNSSSGYSIAFGSNTIANEIYSATFGYYSNTKLYGQLANASGLFSQIGDAQQSLLTARREASLGSAATTILSLDGTGTTNLIIPSGNNRLWAVKVVATAFVSVALPFMALGDSYMAEYTLLFKKIGGVSSVVGVIASNVIYDTNMVDAAFSFAAGASQDLQITFKAPSISGGSTYRCVARVELTEVAY